jgi:prefoldin subunit 5
MIRKDVIVTILIICLVVTLFVVLPTRSSSSIGDYDAGLDTNDDGIIDIKDVSSIAHLYGTNGIATNKTTLLLDVNNTFTTLLSRIDSLNSSLIELHSKVDSMNATNLMPLIDNLNISLLELQSQVNELNSTVIQLQQSDANLQTSLSQLQFSVDALNNTLSSQISSIEAQVSTMNAAITQLQNSNAVLNATLSSLQSQIAILQAQMTSVNNTLALVWDSGWFGPTIGGDTAIYFDKTINVADSLVYMTGKQTLSGDPHQIDYGGFVNFGSYYGAYWWKLTSTSITFHRHGNDGNWVYARITIWQRVTL